MLLKLLNWFRGYLIIKISGISPERFINLCCHRRILLWDLIDYSGSYQFKITIRNYRKLKPIVRKTGIVPKIVQKRGFPFFLQRNKRKKSFFIGLIVCASLVYLMSLFIWDIHILGGYKYTPETMIEFLKKNNITTGIRKSKVDCQEIEETIRLMYNDIGWVSAEIKGTRLIIKITETNMPAPAAKATAPSHIVATKNAIIKSIVTRTGTPMVKEGDVVKKGDIIVSGVLTVKSDYDEIIDKKPVEADAIIRSKSYYDYNQSFSMKYTKRILTGNIKKGHYITFIGKKFNLYNPSIYYDKYDIILEENTLHITDTFYLPFRITSVISREYYEQNLEYTEEEAVIIAKDKLNRYINRLIDNDVLILENNVKITIENNICITKGRIIVEEPAWEYRIIDESEWRIEQTDELNGNIS